MQPQPFSADLQVQMVSTAHVVNHSWDANEVNFLACHTINQNNTSGGGGIVRLLSKLISVLCYHQFQVELYFSNHCQEQCALFWQKCSLFKILKERTFKNLITNIVSQIIARITHIELVRKHNQ